jgi:serine protease Do
MRGVGGWLLQKRSNNLVVIALSTALGGTLAGRWVGENRAVAGDHDVRLTEQRAALALLEDGFTAIADAVEPAVVTIQARATPRPPGAGPGQPRDQDAEAEDRFGFPYEFVPDDGGPPPVPAAKGGSGLIVRKAGRTAYILTNDHVVSGRDQFRVTLQDHSVHWAALVGADRRLDLAVLKIVTPRPLPDEWVAVLGDSSRVRVGQWAIAIGSPYGYDETLTVGVISARDRALSGGVGPYGPYTGLLQTDASINQGNSGGPLVNIDGEVIGINVLIAAAPGTAGSIGIGFAIPINAAKAALGSLIGRGASLAAN